MLTIIVLGFWSACVCTLTQTCIRLLLCRDPSLLTCESYSVSGAYLVLSHAFRKHANWFHVFQTVFKFATLVVLFSPGGYCPWIGYFCLLFNPYVVNGFLLILNKGETVPRLVLLYLPLDPLAEILRAGLLSSKP